MQAAIQKIAQEGVSASTASIPKAAKVDEGSLFRYFADKDTLLNEVYLAIKSDMKRSLTEPFPTKSSLKKRAEHLWNG
ncbi:TetR/AcrR family transcriptional regulator [Terriglobus aquaticus]|uniref:TetR/AcrR family transcriptional regulator n=1 Tax=Terriglobus aquaticus TaxID=940139 RepID=UPI0021E0C9C7|nr:TetR family transcriptional regulator [Terriglobus aquaticus]